MLMTIRDDLLVIRDEIRGSRVTLEAGQPGAPPDHRLKRAAAALGTSPWNSRPPPALVSLQVNQPPR
jgi:hypothetical protein